MNSGFRYCVIYVSWLFVLGVCAQSKTASQYILQADSIYQIGNYAKSFEFYNAASAILKADNPKYLDCRIKSAECMARLGDLKSAQQINKENLALCEKGNAIQKGSVLNGMGLMYLHEGRYDLADKFFTEAYNLCIQSKKTASQLFAEIQNNIGLTNYYNGNQEMALDYIHKSLNERINLFGKNHPVVAGSYINLGLVSQEIDPLKAIDYYKNGLSIFNSVYKGSHPAKANAMMNLALSFQGKKEYDSVIVYLKKATDIWQYSLGANHPNVGFANFSLAQMYKEKSELIEAKNLYNKSLRIYLESYGKKHPETSGVYLALASLEFEENNFKSSLNYIEEAYKSNNENYAGFVSSLYPQLDKVISKDRQLAILLLHAKILNQRFIKQSLKKQDIKNAIFLCLAADTVVSELRKVITTKKDKLRLAAIASEIYDLGITTSLEMSEVSAKSNYYKKLAFQFSEKNKGIVLLEALSEANAKSFAGIPDSLIQKELEIKSKLGFIEQQLAQQTGTNLETALRIEKLALINENVLMIGNFEKQFPQYYQLKFQNRTASVEEIQHKLNKNDVLVSYSVIEATQSMHIFIITKNQFNIVTKNVDVNALKKYLVGFQNAIIYNADKSFVKYANLLHQMLLPSKALQGNKLIIIPDGILALTPFDAIPTTKIRNVTWQEMPFLGKQKSTAYAFSASIWVSAIQNVDINNGIALLAPVTFMEMNTLLGSKQEVDFIDSIFTRSKILSVKLTEQYANKKTFLSDTVTKRSIIHLATHGLVDMHKPELSRIYLYQKEKKENAILYASELYGIKVEAKLMVLSACQTGLGKISKGEGVIGLSRALKYAGAEHIMVSYWSVNDASTSLLMKQFYKYLLNGAPPSEALFESRKFIIQQKEYASPYYWAAFVYLGH